jgi:hypothetical protein
MITNIPNATWWDPNPIFRDRFFVASVDGKEQRKFYIGDKVLILSGVHQGKTMLICGIAPGEYIAGAIDGKTVRINLDNAKIL